MDDSRREVGSGLPRLIGQAWDCALCGVWTEYYDLDWSRFRHNYHLCPGCQDLLIANGEDVRGKEALTASIVERRLKGGR